jgi:ribulose-5-phosphate 4-epimerase/fuculose-1-phosphate aldolase
MTITPISPQTRLVPAVVPDEDLVSPEPPVFATVEEERLHRKQRLAAAFRLFARYQFDEGVAGHITARDPEFTDMFWVNPLGQNFGHIRVSDLVLVDHEGRVVHGRSRINAAAFAIHSALHAARPDVVAAAHSHSLYGKAFSTLGRLLDPITQDACSFYGQHALFDDYTGVVLDPAEGRRIAAALGGGHLVILRNHGLLSAGTSVDAAAWWFIAADRSAHAQLLAEAAGKPILIDEAVATRIGQSAHSFGWNMFQPLWDDIVRQQPDLLD